MNHLLALWEQRATATERRCTDILSARGVDPDARRDGGRANLDARAMTALFGLCRAQADLLWLEEVREVVGPDGPAGS